MGLEGFFDYDESGDGEGDALDFLPSFGEAQWEALLAFTVTERHDAGRVILPLGERERALYIIGEGEVEVRAGTPPRQQRIALCNGGDVIGEQVFLDGQARSAEVRALTDVSLIKLGYDAFEAFAARYPELARAFLLDLGRILSLRLRKTTALLIARR
ncbi:MAG: cyclic nucleotide-binding domain-containing protein [Deltaproteobacteria bacterium]|nr:cyclic nucleotide-binding domain-containing protein [Deltaproteobacteria bacterium]